MPISIIESSQSTIRTHRDGYAIDHPQCRTKYSGNFRSVLRMLGWDEAAARLDDLREELYTHAKARGAISVQFPGRSGVHRSWNLPKNQCVEVVTVYTMTSHLAQSDTGEKSAYPGNQGQALGLMIEAEIKEASLADGPFESQEALLVVIDSCADIARAALASAELLSFDGQPDEEDQEDEENEEPSADAA